jgi:hypothetical protein
MPLTSISVIEGSIQPSIRKKRYEVRGKMKYQTSRLNPNGQRESVCVCRECWPYDHKPVLLTVFLQSCRVSFTFLTAKCATVGRVHGLATSQEPAPAPLSSLLGFSTLPESLPRWLKANPTINGTLLDPAGRHFPSRLLIRVHG